MWTDYFSKLMNDAMTQAKARNHRLSLRAYAKSIDLAPGMLSEIIRRKRVISFPLAVSICERAAIGADSLAELRRLHGDAQSKKQRRVLSMNVAELILDPDYYRYLCALEVLPAPVSQADLGEFLSLSKDRVEKLTSVLSDLEVVEADGKTVRWLGAYLTVEENISNKAIQNFHRRNLESAIEGISLPIDQREYTSVIFAGSEALLGQGKEAIREWRTNLSERMRGASPDRIYQLSIELRPVSPKAAKKRGDA